MKTRPLFLSLALCSLAACGDKTDTDSTTSTAKPAVPTQSKPTPPTKPAEPTPTALAYRMGNKYGFAVNFGILKKQDLVDKNMAVVREIAGKLGVSAPELPSKGKNVPSIVRVVEGDLRKKSPAIADGFVLGQELADQFMGASLDMISTDTLTNIGVRLKGAGLKGNAVKTKYDGLGAKPSSDQIGALEEACSAELKIAMD